ncbi:MAG: leucyl/phenylalanyl-tRNA--protein transferase [Pseudomonadota bacterium]
MREPDGLLAAGGDLSAERLLYAYTHGIFPWYDDGQPILWWAPDPRCIIRPERFHVSRRLARSVRQSALELTFNQSFSDVVLACAGPRRQQHGTWITEEMIVAYSELHRRGWAHSVEVVDGDRLVGGIYGLAIGRVFFGESMFSHETNASKMAMLALCRILEANGFELIDCQVTSGHLITLGAETIPRDDFSAIIAEACAGSESFDAWPTPRLPVRELVRTSG